MGNPVTMRVFGFFPVKYRLKYRSFLRLLGGLWIALLEAIEIPGMWKNKSISFPTECFHSIASTATKEKQTVLEKVQLKILLDHGVRNLWEIFSKNSDL